MIDPGFVAFCGHATASGVPKQMLLSLFAAMKEDERAAWRAAAAEVEAMITLRVGNDTCRCGECKIVDYLQAP